MVGGSWRGRFAGGHRCHLLDDRDSGVSQPSGTPLSVKQMTFSA
jgi:hypothetical protein